MKKFHKSLNLKFAALTFLSVNALGFHKAEAMDPLTAMAMGETVISLFSSSRPDLSYEYSRANFELLIATNERLNNIEDGMIFVMESVSNLSQKIEMANEIALKKHDAGKIYGLFDEITLKFLEDGSISSDEKAQLLQSHGDIRGYINGLGDDPNGAVSAVPLMFGAMMDMYLTRELYEQSVQRSGVFSRFFNRFGKGEQDGSPRVRGDDLDGVVIFHKEILGRLIDPNYLYSVTSQRIELENEITALKTAMKFAELRFPEGKCNVEFIPNCEPVYRFNYAVSNLPVDLVVSVIPIPPDFAFKDTIKSIETGEKEKIYSISESYLDDAFKFTRLHAAFPQSKIWAQNVYTNEDMSSFEWFDESSIEMLNTKRVKRYQNGGAPTDDDLREVNFEDNVKGPGKESINSIVSRKRIESLEDAAEEHLENLNLNTRKLNDAFAAHYVLMQLEEKTKSFIKNIDKVDPRKEMISLSEARKKFRASEQIIYISEQMKTSDMRRIIEQTRESRTIANELISTKMSQLQNLEKQARDQNVADVLVQGLQYAQMGYKMYVSLSSLVDPESAPKTVGGPKFEKVIETESGDKNESQGVTTGETDDQELINPNILSNRQVILEAIDTLNALETESDDDVNFLPIGRFSDKEKAAHTALFRLAYLPPDPGDKNFEEYNKSFKSLERNFLKNAAKKNWSLVPKILFTSRPVGNASLISIDHRRKLTEGLVVELQRRNYARIQKDPDFKKTVGSLNNSLFDNTGLDVPFDISPLSDGYLPKNRE